VEDQFFGQNTSQWYCASCFENNLAFSSPLKPLPNTRRRNKSAQGSNKRAKIVPEIDSENIPDAVFWTAARRRYLYGRELHDMHQELETLRRQRDEQSDAMLQREAKLQSDREELTNAAEAARVQMREQEKRALDHEEVIGLRDKTIDDCNGMIEGRNKTIENLNGMIEGRNKTIEDLNRMIESRDKTIEECDKNLVKAQEQISDRDKDLSDVQHQLESHDKELAKAQEQVSSRDKDLEKAQERIEKLDSVRKRFAQNLSDGQKIVGELDGDG